jgi:hypothetical protein
MTTKITIKFIKPNAVFESSAAAYDDKKALYSDEAKESINKNYALLQELNTFTAPIQLEWDPESFTLYVHKFIDPEQIALYWAIHQLIAETTNNQPTNGWTFIDIVETPNYSTT